MLFLFYPIILIFLTVYSYSQIDLNLTLWANPIYQNIQRQLILLGYYNRPFSTGILILLIIFLYLLFIRLIYQAIGNRLKPKNLFTLVISAGIILLFSYSAFSHDLFNYMFDARILTFYHQNPYIHSALDFPADLWTRFMHWTHRTYPYGPVWLFLTVPASWLGLGKFVLTLFNFKLLFVVFYLGNVYLIYKILKKVNKKSAILGTVVYAFNPVVFIESLVSPHNEVMMLFFLLLGIDTAVVGNKRASGIVLLLLSAGIKFTTVILLPVFILPGHVVSNLLGNLSKIFKRVRYDNTAFWLMLILYIPVLIIEIINREPYPWYFIPLIGLGALLPEYMAMNMLISGVSLAAFLRYLPFIYTGDYGKWTGNAQNMIFSVTIALTVLAAFIWSKFRRKLML